MSPLHIAAGAVAVGLLVYLFAALFKPEWFS
jgi:K+-transporting ATPase KdpF subunit